MALAFDAFSQSQVASGTTLTFAHTCTGSDRLLIVGISDENANANPTATYDGVSMTLVDTQGTLSIFVLANPSTGSNNIVITRSGTTSGTLYGWGYSMTGASASQPDNSTKDSASGVTSLTGTLTTVADNCWCVMVARADNAGMAPGANSTEKSTPIVGYDAWAFFDNSGVAPITPAGSTSMTFSGTNGTLSYVMISIAPVTSVNYTKTLTEAGTFTDARINSMGKIFSDGVSHSEVFSSVRSATTTLVETVTHTETFTRIFQKILVETMSSLENISFSLAKTLLEASVFIEAFSQTLSRVLSEASSYVEAITVRISWQKRTKPTSIWTDRTKPPTTWT